MRIAPARLLAVLLSIASLAPVSAQAGVLISEMCDPLSNFDTDRFIEIYNSGPAAVDLTGWKLVAIANTTTEPVTWNLFGSIAAGEAKVAGNSTTVAVFPVHFPNSAWNRSITNQGSWNWNGSTGDGAKLLDASNAIVDFAVVTVASTFSDKTYVRNPGVTTGNVTYTSSEWTATPVTLATNASPGTHNGGSPPSGVPVIANVVTLPAFPLLGNPVDVQANVVDTVAAITTVTLTWGTSATPPFPNSIPMTLLSGSTYQTSSQIPAPAPGVTVYYRVTATDAVSNTQSSAAQSFSPPQTLTIAQIQGTGASSPYNGMSAITSGVVTSVFGTIFTIQDGVGARSGMWVKGSATPTVSDVVTVQGVVTEGDAFGLANNTLLTSAVISSTTPGGTLPAPEVLTTASAITEPYEGVLVKVVSATCSSSIPGGTWVVNDGSGAATIDRLGGYSFAPVVTSAYTVTGTLTFSSSAFKIEPRANADIELAGDASAPTITSVGEMSDSTLLVFFSEAVDEASAEVPSKYTVGALAGVDAVRDPANPSQVLVTIRNIPPGARTLTTTGVADLFANSAVRTKGFTYIDVYPPVGYYDAVFGLRGAALRWGLYNIIRNHTVVSYGDVQDLGFPVSDVKPNGKVWDPYSDIPGGTPPYEYDFSDPVGSGSTEGLGYNREHSFPDAWFGGGSPMHSDMWIVYPTDTKVNNLRSSYPYGDVGTASNTSQNGSKLGGNASPGYGGTVFEPIDAFKGDLIRSHFYVLTRYVNVAPGWSGSGSVSGGELVSWARDLYLQWSANDPVSWKERMRNGAIYTYFQHNRNPFVDHPEYVSMIWDSTSAVSVDAAKPRSVRLSASAPNPFGVRSAIHFDLPQRDRVSLRVYDVTGRAVRTLASGVLESGTHQAVWDGRNDAGATLEAGLYFYRLEARAVSATQRVVFVR